jgi:hypothetical protein
MQGRRLPDGFEPTTDWLEKLGVTELPKGGYGKDTRGTWCVITPNGRYGSIAKHTVIEHEDGTITVSPSILIYPVEPHVYAPDERARLVEAADENYVRAWEAGKPGWHGWLERGVWREC